MNSYELITENLLEQIVSSIQESSTIYILTSFTMLSGVKLLKPHLQEAAKRGVEIKICTGDYLYITQPEALLALTSIGPSVEARLWKSLGRSFHPKAYLFQSQENGGTFFIGSSNLSASALSNGVEWNLKVSQQETFETFDEAMHHFMEIFYHEQTITVNQETVHLYQQDYSAYHEKNPHLQDTWHQLESKEHTDYNKDYIDRNKLMIIDPPTTYDAITPRPAQKKALDSLQNTYEEGYKKAMIVMATGLGKTYLAAFFAKTFKRVLFIAHREEILTQASQSFQKVIPNLAVGLYNGANKDTNARCIFASIFTLSMKHHLDRFSPDDFDLIIVDEFHHAAADSYLKVIEKFKPKFLLGITATPDRTDQKDVYQICDGNVAYKIDFIEAIQNGWLAPFNYYGVYDPTDYSGLRWLGTRYDDEELLALQLRDSYADNVFKAWLKHRKSRTLVFCSSVRQANYLSHYFNQQEFRTVSLNAQSNRSLRGNVIEQLKKGGIDALFTVDLFNEGVDIPSVDTLLFARPTESLTIFTQQMGRGLRLYENKESCTVIDLIGNYRHADLKLSLFEREPQGNNKIKQVEPVVPQSCYLELDLRVIELIEELRKKVQPRKTKLLNAYLLVKQELGRRPTYLELHLKGSINSIEYKQEFGSYMGFLKWVDELSDKESNIYSEYDKWIQEVERTGMAKSYKMVVLKYMLSRGYEDWYKPVKANEISAFFHTYLTEKPYRKRIDFSDKSSKRLWEYDEEKVSKLIEDMPMSKWSGSSKGIVQFENGEFWFKLGSLSQQETEYLYKWTKGICDYRLHWHFERKA